MLNVSESNESSRKKKQRRRPRGKTRRSVRAQKVEITEDAATIAGWEWVVVGVQEQERVQVEHERTRGRRLSHVPPIILGRPVHFPRHPSHRARRNRRRREDSDAQRAVKHPNINIAFVSTHISEEDNATQAIAPSHDRAPNFSATTRLSSRAHLTWTRLHQPNISRN